MDWNNTQNLLSNIVFGILLFAMIIYWISFSLFKGTKNIVQLGKLSAIIANILLFFTLCSRWIVAGYFPLSNLYESLLFLTWILLTIYLYLEFKTKSKLLGAVLLPITLLINGFANLTLSAEMQKSSPLVPALQSNWLMMHVSMMMLSYATLIIGSLFCILFLVLSKLQDVDLQLVEESPSLVFYNLDYYEVKLFSKKKELSRPINFSFDNNPLINWELFPNKTKIHIYRIVQESLQNIYKHASAKTIKISFKIKNNIIFIEIKDDGKGFNIAKAKKGIGLKNIQSRVKDIKGELKVSSQINLGSSFEILIPQDNIV